MLRRFAPLAVVLTLLGATAVAFGVSERLKLERAPIAAPNITKVFSPISEGETSRASIAFRVREAGRVSVAIVDEDGDVVRRLVEERPRSAGERLETTWDGRNGEGAVVREGIYRPRVRLTRDRRTIILPNPIRVDTTPPRIIRTTVRPQFFSPDGDGRNDQVRVTYRLDEKANAMLFANGVREVRTRFRPTEGVLTWNGKIDGRLQRAGLYRLQVGAEDQAGNRARPTKPAFVQIAYIDLGRQTVRAKARTRFGVRVTTDAKSYRWRFAGGTGTGKTRLLVLRAPRAGRYTLFVEANGHADKASVIVTPRPDARRNAS